DGTTCDGVCTVTAAGQAAVGVAAGVTVEVHVADHVAVHVVLAGDAATVTVLVAHVVAVHRALRLPDLAIAVGGGAAALCGIVPPGVMAARLDEVLEALQVAPHAAVDDPEKGADVLDE